MANTRTSRSPQNFEAVTMWDFTHVPWTQLKVDFPTAAQAWADEADEDVLTREDLWDDEPFLSPDGNLYILANITGPGGSLWMMWLPLEGFWDEVLLDDDTGKPVDF